MNTPTGTFAVYYKVKKQTMRGVDHGVPWVVPNVPNVMYIVGGVALHGTYWHNLFGSGRAALAWLRQSAAQGRRLALRLGTDGHAGAGEVLNDHRPPTTDHRPPRIDERPRT